MSQTSAALLSLCACGLAALLEGFCAGRNVRSFFATLKFPSGSPPLWVWGVIGALYYATFFIVLYLLLLEAAEEPRSWIIALVLVMMTVNALANYVIFRSSDLRLNFIIGGLFPVADVTLLVFLVYLDTPATWALVPYLLYRAFAVWWCYALWKLNERQDAPLSNNPVDL